MKNGVKRCLPSNSKYVDKKELNPHLVVLIGILKKPGYTNAYAVAMTYLIQAGHKIYVNFNSQLISFNQFLFKMS